MGYTTTSRVSILNNLQWGLYMFILVDKPTSAGPCDHHDPTAWPTGIRPNISCSLFRACLQPSWASKTILQCISGISSEHLGTTLATNSIFVSKTYGPWFQQPKWVHCLDIISYSIPWESLFLDYFGLSLSFKTNPSDLINQQSFCTSWKPTDAQGSVWVVLEGPRPKASFPRFVTSFTVTMTTTMTCRESRGNPGPYSL